jgi:hypothetical protein
MARATEAGLHLTNAQWKTVEPNPAVVRHMNERVKLKPWVNPAPVITNQEIFSLCRCTLNAIRVIPERSPQVRRRVHCLSRRTSLPHAAMPRVKGFKMGAGSVPSPR